MNHITTSKIYLVTTYYLTVCKVVVAPSVADTTAKSYLHTNEPVITTCYVIFNDIRVKGHFSEPVLFYTFRTFCTFTEVKDFKCRNTESSHCCIDTFIEVKYLNTSASTANNNQRV